MVIYDNEKMNIKSLKMLEINISVFINNSKVWWSLHLLDQQSTQVILDFRQDSVHQLG